jgi:hypothetical protein
MVSSERVCRELSSAEANKDGGGGRTCLMLGRIVENVLDELATITEVDKLSTSSVRGLTSPDPIDSSILMDSHDDDGTFFAADSRRLFLGTNDPK